MQKRNPLVSAMLAFAAMALRPINRGATSFRSGTPSRKKVRNKDGLPAYYPGAKLARKAATGKLTLRWS
jgi:hypothetical protein